MLYQIESKSLVDVVLYYLYYRTFVSILFLTFISIIIVFGVKWITGGAKNLFEWRKRGKLQEIDMEILSYERRKQEKIIDAEIDNLVIENEIDKRVKKLDKLSNIETEIRQEIDKISEIKAKRDR